MKLIHIEGNVVFAGKVLVQTSQIDFTTASVSAIFYPISRYPAGVGGSNSRILVRLGETNGKPSYIYGDETLSWSNAPGQWEMRNIYSGVINYSPEDTQYPWQVNNWFYDSNIPANDVDAVPLAV